MRLLLQRARYGSVTIDGQLQAEIQNGLVVLAGFTPEDQSNDVDRLALKLAHLRIFEDEAGLMNLSILDKNATSPVQYSVLSVSQFTLYADCRKGRRPSFVQAAKPETALPLYNHFNQQLEKLGIPVATGSFGADMQVKIINDGPVTIWLDSAELKRP